jgi:hypothetical protein
MAINFTEPSKKNITVQFESQDKTELDSTIGGDSVKIDVNRPDKFKTPTIGDAIELSDILEGIDIRYVASTAGYSNGDTVSYWANSGGLEGYNLNHLGSIVASKPTFDVGGTNNPFPAGAIRFAVDTDGGASQVLWWGTEADGTDQSLKIDPPFTIYAVMSKDNASGFASPKRMSSPLWTKSTLLDDDEAESRPSFQVVPTVFSDGDSGLTVRLRDPAFIFKTDPVSYTPAGKNDNMTVANGDPIIIVVTVDSDKNISCFDFDAKNFINEKKDIGSFPSNQTKNTLIVNSFGGPTNKPLGMRVDGSESDLPLLDGDAIYIAEFGYFSKKLEGQQASALGMLLKQKYEIT